MKKWKKAVAVLSVAILAGAVDFAPNLPMVSATSQTQKDIDRTQEERDKLKGELDKQNQNLDQLEGKRDTLEKELDYLNAQLSAVVENLEELEGQIRDKEQEISDTQEALEEARETEQWQYACMVLVVRYMYEYQADNYIASLLSAGSLSELLNRADRIEKVVAYDQKMLQEYMETRVLIEEQEARLQEERRDLEALQAKAEEEKGKVSSLIDATAGSIAQYENQIADAERKAKEYEEAIKKKEADLAYLKKRLAQEIALSQAAANAKWRDISEVTFAEGDRKLLANLIYCEAGGEPYEGQVAVGSVVINRVLSSRYPDTIVGVIYQKGQFSPAGSGRLGLALSVDKATASCYRAADAAMSGVTNVGNCVYFRTPIPGLTGINIGGHVFY